MSLVFISIPNNLVTFDLSQVNREEIDEPMSCWSEVARQDRGERPDPLRLW